MVSPNPTRTARDLATVVMAKVAVPGRVKTRLIGPLTPQQAAMVHQAMLDCVLERIAAHVPARHVLALAGEATLHEAIWPADWMIIDQGDGDLGRRMEHVWRAIGGGPIVFLGVDSPDVPAAALRAIGPALATHDVAIGPVSDGGYWTLAARRLAPALLRGIDWGTPAVYDQTLAAARRAGLSVSALPPWHDVDEPADLDALRQRLATASAEALDPALLRLRERLRAACETRP